MAYFDINMLRMMKKKSKIMQYLPQMNATVVTEQTYNIMKDFKRYFDTFPDHETIDFTLFIPRMDNWNKSLSEEVLAARIATIRAVAKADITESVEAGLQREIANSILSTKLSLLAGQYADGELEDLGQAMSFEIEGYKKNAGVAVDDHITERIAVLLEEDNDEAGYVFRLLCLKLSMRGLRGGDFGILAGRPDKGKTTLLASEITYLAPQIPKHRNVLWLNNEGPGRRIIPRLYQAALGIKRSEMVEMNAAGTLEAAYKTAMGRWDKIRVVDIHGMHSSNVERLIEAHDAEIVVFDMIDNIRGFENAGRTDERLEQMYAWGRECAVKHNFAGIATSQISVEGDGEMFPSMSMLKDSKTGKQGACDFQIHIGASNSPELAGLRYIGIPKNKLRREGTVSDPRATVNFRPEIARYVDDDIPEE